ncbi:MAG: hypothetical protein HS108_14420 [Planctomycetes bacterium]|nr:hypothetical protein [Planctomycetota bacterium]
MPKHDYRELARELVHTGCLHIAEQHHEKGKPAEKVMVDAAITAQRRLVIDPDLAFTTDDFKALTSEIERFKEELDMHIAREPDICDDTGYHLRKLRNTIAKTIACAATICTQNTLPEVTELLGKAWNILQDAEDEARTLCKFRNQLILGFLAEFKHASNPDRN